MSDGAEDPLASAHAKIAQLERALQSSRLIGTAIGILMERHKVTSDQAFRELVVASQATQVKLHVLATRLIDTGEWPAEATVGVSVQTRS